MDFTEYMYRTKKKYHVAIALSVGRRVRCQTEDHIGALWSYE